jgi:hypothetical protein
MSRYLNNSSVSCLKTLYCYNGHMLVYINCDAGDLWQLSNYRRMPRPTTKLTRPSACIVMNFHYWYLGWWRIPSSICRILANQPGGLKALYHHSDCSGYILTVGLRDRLILLTILGSVIDLEHRLICIDQPGKQ